MARSAPQPCRTAGCQRQRDEHHAYCGDCTDRILHRALAGQALVEFALILPLLMAVFLGAAEMGMLYVARADQDHRTSTLATWAGEHPAATEAEWSAIVATVGPCADATVDTPGPDLVRVAMTCQYEPRVTSNLWRGLPVSSEAVAAIRGEVAGASATPAP